MKRLRAIRQSKPAGLILVGAALLIGLAGCAARRAEPAKPVLLDYDSVVGDPYAIRSGANILVRINEDNLWQPYRNPEAKHAIADAVKKDLQQNLFYYGSEEFDVLVLVKINDLSFKHKGGVITLAALFGGTGFAVYHIIAGEQQAMRIEVEEHYLLALAGLGVSLSALFIPDHKYTGTADLTIEIRDKEGSLKNIYNSNKVAVSKPMAAISSKKDVSPYYKGSGGGLIKEALKIALEDIKSKIIADKDKINRAIQGIETVPEPEMLPPVARSRPKVQEGATNIAVMDLDAFAISEPEAQALTNRLRVELFSTGRFVVLERGRMQDILKEQGFQETGCTTNECLVEVGQLLNMQHMVAGSVSKVGDVYSIELRMIDVGTGEIMAAAVEDIAGSLGDLLTKGIRNAALKLTR